MGYRPPNIFGKKKQRYQRYVVPSQRFEGDSFSGGGVPDIITPDEIANLIGWYKIDALSLNDNDPIDTITDQSGNANDLISGGANRPLFKTNQINGKPVARFDGINDFVGQNIAGLVQPYSVYFLYKHIAVGAFNVNDIVFDGAAGLCAYLVANTPRVEIVAGASLFDNNAVPADGIFEIIVAEFNGANSKLYVNNVERLSGNAGANDPLGFIIGALFTFTRNTNIDFAEAMLYTRILNSTERVNLHTYLQDKYAL